MTVATCLLFALGVLGGADILLYHAISHGIRRNAGSRAELFTHFLRGPTYAALFLLVPNFTFTGTWLLALLLLLLFDLVISLADFWVESRSRQGLGGLPRGEYVLHVILAMLFGALVCAVFYEGGGLGEETALVWNGGSEGAPVLLRVALAIMAPLVLWTGIKDLAAMLRLRRRAT